MTDAKKVLEQVIKLWNASEREPWADLYADDVVYEAPGGARISGLANLKAEYFDALVTAAPDRGSRDVMLIAEGDDVVEQARYTGTHTGPRETQTVSRFRPPEEASTFRCRRLPGRNGKISSIRIYYDQVELFTQLGLMPAATPS